MLDTRTILRYNGRVMGVLYLVATPIGNLEDVSLRALRILREVSFIAAEDTRTTAKLLSRYDIHTPMISFFEHNELVKRDEILSALESADIALVSEAGMPAISDPGYRLVQAATAAGASVTVIPGPSALVSALAVSGLPTDSFVFLGFLPRRRGPRQRLLAEARAEKRTLIAYEAPHRLVEALDDILAQCGDRQVVVAGELTKMFEEVWRGPVSAALDHFRQKPPRGEYTLVLAGNSGAGETAWPQSDILAALAQELAAGATRRDAVARVVKASGWARRAVYRLAIRTTPTTSVGTE